MGQALQRSLKAVQRGIIAVIMLLMLSVASFFTPLFSTIGLWVLNHLPIPEANHAMRPLIYDLNANQAESATAPTLPLNWRSEHEPTAYVVLGGGLTEAGHKPNRQKSAIANKGSDTHVANRPPSSPAQKNTPQLSPNSIVLNQYSLNRMQTVIWHYKKNPLPIILTGVEAPWMRDWLLNYGIDNIITENASMNTCENARFTAKRLNLSDVYLITDAYHMTRTRRQFALNNIHTSPIVATLPMQKSWLHPKDNAQHSRRTLYELAAYARDVFAPQQNCRRASEVSFDTLLRSRKPEDVKVF